MHQTLVERSWEMCGFKPYETYQVDIKAPIVGRNESMSQSGIISVAERTVRIDAVQHYLDSENEAEPHFEHELV
eukprot:15348695-Ditylum_brightwellii.AAC.1